MGAKQQAILNERENMTCDGEPLLTRTRSVQNYGSGETLYINPTAEGAEILGITEADNVRIDVFADRIEISADSGGSDD